MLAPLFVLTLIIPVFFYVGPLRLAPFLLLLIVAFIPLCFIWATNAGGVRAPDLLILFSCLWGTMALFRAHGTEAVEPAGILVLQTFGAYLMGRCLVRNKASCRTIFNVYFMILVLLLPFAILETRNGVPYYLNLWSWLGSTYDNLQMPSRKGLERAQVAFEHPILYGIFVSSGFAVLFYRFRGGIKKAIVLLISTVLAITSVSTGALVCLGTQWGIMLWGKVFRHSPNRWRNLVLVAIAGYVTVDFLSNRTPFHVFVDYLTFSQGSAYKRIVIWEYGTAEVARHPFFGIGMNEWTRADWMSASMDNFWLLIAVRYGLPAAITLALGFLLILFRVGRRQGLDEETVIIRRGMIISLVGVLMAIGSVHLWNATFCWLMFLIGSMVWIMDEGEVAKSRTSPKSTASQSL